MTDKVIKNMLNSIDLDTLSVLERTEYNLLRSQGFSKMIALLKLVYHYNDLSYSLYEIKELVNEYELKIKL